VVAWRETTEPGKDRAFQVRTGGVMRYETGNTDAVVLAGGINRIELYDGFTPGYKAILSVGGKPLISYTLDALNETGRIGRICIVGPVEVRDACPDADRYEYVESGSTMKESVAAGLRHFFGSPLILFIMADLPLVTPAAINDFLDAVGQIETSYKENVFWALLPEESFNGPYRQVEKGYNRFRDVSVCHGNLLLMTPSLAGNDRFVSVLDRIYAARKDSVRAAMAAGPLIGASYFLGVRTFRLFTLGRMAKVVSLFLGAGIVPVLLYHPEAAVDVDEPADYAFVKKYLGHEDDFEERA
jgi:GTP:adenosylcobinamide-phosphate guanylyltransferase